METILLVVQLIIALALIGAVLIQRSDSDGFGLGSGSGSNFMTGRAAASLLTRATAVLATLFILNSLALGIIAHNRSSSSVAEAIEALEKEAPAEPEVPVPGDAPGKENKKPAKASEKKANTSPAEKPKKPAAKKPSAPSVPVAE